MSSCVMLCDDGERQVCAQSSVVVDQRSTLPASSLFLVPLDSCRPLYIVFIFIVVARGPKYQEQLTFTLCLSNVCRIFCSLCLQCFHFYSDSQRSKISKEQLNFTLCYLLMCLTQCVCCTGSTKITETKRRHEGITSQLSSSHLVMLQVNVPVDSDFFLLPS